MNLIFVSKFGVVRGLKIKIKPFFVLNSLLFKPPQISLAVGIETEKDRVISSFVWHRWLSPISRIFKVYFPVEVEVGTSIDNDSDNFDNFYPINLLIWFNLIFNLNWEKKKKKRKENYWVIKSSTIWISDWIL